METTRGSRLDHCGPEVFSRVNTPLRSAQFPAKVDSRERSADRSRDRLAHANEPDKGALIPACTCKILPIMTPFHIPHLVPMLFQNIRGKQWELLTAAAMVSVKRKRLGIKGSIVI